ncbi:uncharacterized protein [Physcomitrium patens]|uniref:Uncharacterized protein n=1 Tax=Physcomitrium patens TaxID=3218 RepID=A0A2K1KT81_PHYPA|nr:uncharacterized protein LOC112280207 [Physcomitrium patens]XP_024371195.1 uncharacterized protein LOC112280207 [Physcomitrium patens]PNR56971.1 hypothetical protein PHYPA_003964 [Physcomitrium patens]|eukprot:XP_024371194.1 uncharacterized protein LOC112280207 [Physcomitrella patens]
MVIETGLQATSRKSGELVRLKDLQALPLGMSPIFKLPQPGKDEDDDGNDCISLKKWQPDEIAAQSIISNGMSYSAWRPVKEKQSTASVNGITVVRASVRKHPIGYAPLVEANGDVSLPPSMNGNTHPKQLSENEPKRIEQDEWRETGHGYITSDEDPEDELEDQVANTVKEPEVKEERTIRPHHQHNISLVNGIAPPPAQAANSEGIVFDISRHEDGISISPSSPRSPQGGIAFDITLDGHYDDSLPRRSTGSSRDNARHVSFVTGRELELDLPSPPRSKGKSPYRSRKNHSKSPVKSKPGWDSSAKVGTPPPPMPKKFVRPTLHGIKVKKGQGGVAKTAARATMTSAEIHQGIAIMEGRSRDVPVARSWDPQYCGGGEYDSVSQLISKSLASAADEIKEDPHGFHNRQYIPRSNGGRKQDDNGETLKLVGSESNKLTGEFGRFFSKLRRSSGPVAKPPPKIDSKAVSPRASSNPIISKIARGNLDPVDHPKSTAKKNLAPVHSLDVASANQKIAIGSYASLKLLQECAKTEQIPATPACNAHKPRKIRDHEPHRHYYKTISKTLDSKLKN